MIETLLIRHLKDVKGHNVLEVGPGYGRFGRLAAELVGAESITFVDCDSTVLDYQLLEAKSAGLKAKAVNLLLDSTSVASIDCGYDLILCQEVLEHLHDAELVLNMLARRLSGVGYLVVTVPTQRSERWLRFLNPSYMCGEPHAHVREFDAKKLQTMISDAGLVTEAFIPTQPHYFLAHTWLFGTRARVQASTGTVLEEDFRTRGFRLIGRWSKRVFQITGPQFWGRLLPRNYFVLARFDGHTESIR
jgi:SAM-dependent methyltransferase